MPKTAPNLVDELRDALGAARRDYAARRAEYTADLIRCEARVRRLEAEIREAQAERVRPLRSGAPNVKLHSMPALAPIMAPLSRPNGGVGRKMSPGPLNAVGNLARWAREHGLLYSTVKRWRTPGKSGTRIPSVWADVFLREYGVPLAYWPRGVAPVPKPPRPAPTRPYRPRRRSPR